MKLVGYILLSSVSLIGSWAYTQPKVKVNEKAIIAAKPVAGNLQKMSLDDYLGAVAKNHGTFLALEKSDEASLDRKTGGDIALVPVLSLKAASTDDKNPQNLGSYLIDHNQITEYSVGLSKKFSTGTQAQVSASLADYKTSLTNLSTTPAQSSSTSYGKGSLGIYLSQSLWKDFFGSATRLRQDRESQTEKLEKESYNLQRRQLLIEAESVFWNYLYSQEELEQRKDSLDRAKKIEAWVRRRVGNGIGDQADLLNAQGLVASRELQLLTAQDEFQAVEKALRDNLQLSSNEPTPQLEAKLNSQRNIQNMVYTHSRAPGAGDRVVRLDTYLSEMESRVKSIAAKEVVDAYRPDLTLEGQYKTNAQENSLSDTSSKITQTDKPTQYVAVKFTWLFDTEIKNSAVHAAQADALAADLKSKRKVYEAESAWFELQRRHGDLMNKIKAAELASNIQNQKAAAQRDKLSKGRAVTTDVITAEQDAAESKLLLTKLLAEQRKLEAQGRMFLVVEGRE